MRQSSFFIGCSHQDLSKVGYVNFHPDQPTVIHTALRSHYVLSKAGAVNFLSGGCSLQFEITKSNTNQVTEVHVLGAYDRPEADLFDLYCYNKNNDCVYRAHAVTVVELAHELCIGLGFRRKSKPKS